MKYPMLTFWLLLYAFPLTKVLFSVWCICSAQTVVILFRFSSKQMFTLILWNGKYMLKENYICPSFLVLTSLIDMCQINSKGWSLIVPLLQSTLFKWTNLSFDIGWSIYLDLCYSNLCSHVNKLKFGLILNF